MNRFIIILFFLPLMFSCEEKIFTDGINCEECYQIKPDSADLFVKLTFNSIYDTIPLTVYRNEVENNDKEYVDTAYGSPYYLYVPVNKKYSIAVEYITGTTKIIAIDGTKLEIKHVRSACDKECWIIEGGDMDARLKY